MTEAVKKLAVLGYPIRHSLSPVIHGEWIRQYGVNATYNAIEVAPEALEHFMRHTMFEENYAGVNLTIPHKEAAMKFVDSLEGVPVHPSHIGAINTLWMHDEKLVGLNTDAWGFEKNLSSKCDLKHTAKKSLVLGAGGAAKAVCFALDPYCDELIITNRTRARAEALAAHIKTASSKEKNAHVTVIDWSEIEVHLKDITLLVNTTSLGMKGQPPLEISLDNLPRNALVTDIVYNPLITPLLGQAKARGNAIVDGLGMLLYQAANAFHIWFPEIMPEVTDELRERVLQELR
ncbi:MAG TPA: shikimate dehydrogenase [Rickettsiales bacterium]|nr:shikimate dehydrogenase [Rickettsiales bacterium]